MKTKISIIFGLVCLVALAAMGANPSFTSFNTTQFDVTGNLVAITNGVIVTNISSPGTNGAGGTFLNSQQFGTGAAFGAKSINTTATGAQALATNSGSSSYGDASSAYGVNSSSYGTGSVASNGTSSAFGANGLATGASSSVFGANTTASANQASAFGSGSTSAFSRSTAVGTGATTTSNDQIMIGTGGQVVTTPGIWAGNGSGLTNLPATSLTGVVPLTNGGTGSGTGNGSGLTNLYLGDGGSNNAFGSPSAMNPNFNTGPTVYSMGSPTGWGLTGDNALIFVGASTNFTANGGLGASVTGYGASGATVISRTGGPTLGYISTNETDGFMSGGSSIVQNNSSINKFFAIIFPAGGSVAAQDTMNYGGLIVDSEYSQLRVPLLPTLFTNGGCNQPDSVMWDFTCTAPTTAPAFVNDGYIDSAGKVFTAYSNNVAKTHIFFVSSSAGNPVGAGTLTRINTPGTGDATITYSSVVSNRTYIGDSFLSDWRFGTNYCKSNLALATGHVLLAQTGTNNNGLNIFSGSANQGAALTFGTTSGMGIGESISRGVLSMQLGTGGEPFVAAINPNHPVNNGWFPSAVMAQVTGGGLELGDANNFGNFDWGTDGSSGTGITNYAANRTATVDDGTIIMRASGVQTITLPDSTFHARGRQYDLIADAATNVTVATTSAQTIGNNSSQTSLTLVPGQAVPIQSDAVGWKFTYSPGVITTNFVSGQVYNNTYGRLIEVRANATITTTGVAGNASLSLLASGYQTNYFGQSTLVTSIAGSATNVISMVIPPGQNYTFTNTSSGAGDSASVVGGQILVY